MQNYGMPFGHELKIIGEADTIILHFAFSILHSKISPQGLWNVEK